MNQTIELDGEFFDTQQVTCQRLGIAATTMRTWRKNGVVPEPKKMGNGSYFKRSQIEKIFREQLTGSNT